MAHPWVLPFLHQLRTLGICAKAARAVGVDPTAVHGLRARDADFAAAYDDALEEAIDGLEAEAWRRAKDGIDTPVVYQGQLTPVWERDENGQVLLEAYDTGSVDKDGKPVWGQRQVQARNPDGSPQFLVLKSYSDTLLMGLLKGRRKRVFAERTEITGADGKPVQLEETAKLARLAQLVALATARKAAADSEEGAGSKWA